jgi:hypothetical protein
MARVPARYIAELKHNPAVGELQDMASQNNHVVIRGQG